MERPITKNRIAAVAIIENSEKQLLLLNRNYEPYGFCLPGGKINIQEESIIDGLLRELEEELGMKFPKLGFSYQGQYESIKGVEVHVFRYNYSFHDSPRLSSEHSSYLFTSSLERIPLAGNTEEFLSTYQFDSSKIDFGYEFDFGKYSGKPLHSIIQNDPQYIMWVENNTQHKFTKKVLDATKEKLQSEKAEKLKWEEQYKAEEYAQAREMYDENQRKENLKTAVSADGFGKVIPIGQGQYKQIDSEGNANGKIVEWYYGWSETDHEDDGY